MKFAYASSLDSIGPKEVKKLSEENKAIIIDVREASEVKEGKVKGAIVIPMSLMDSNKNSWNAEVDKLPKDKTVVVYCRSGRRSGLVATELRSKGYKVLNMGSFESWQSAGFPTE